MIEAVHRFSRGLRDVVSLCRTCSSTKGPRLSPYLSWALARRAMRGTEAARQVSVCAQSVCKSGFFPARVSAKVASCRPLHRNGTSDIVRLSDTLLEGQAEPRLACGKRCHLSARSIEGCGSPACTPEIVTWVRLATRRRGRTTGRVTPLRCPSPTPCHLRQDPAENF